MQSIKAVPSIRSRSSLLKWYSEPQLKDRFVPVKDKQPYDKYSLKAQYLEKLFLIVEQLVIDVAGFSLHSIQSSVSHNPDFPFLVYEKYTCRILRPFS